MSLLFVILLCLPVVGRPPSVDRPPSVGPPRITYFLFDRRGRSLRRGLLPSERGRFDLPAR
jgi:hypothetical protein